MSNKSILSIFAELHTQGFTKGARGMQSEMERTAAAAKRTGALIAATVGASMTALGASALASSAKIESLRVSLESLVGGTSNAARVMQDLNNFAAGTPFQIEGITNAFRQLVASGSEVSEAKDQLQFLGDIAAVSGSQINEIAAIFSKVNAKGKVELENLNQLAERGIPIFEMLAEATGLPADSLGAGAVSVSEFNAVLASMSEAGGFADGAMLNLSQTLSGKMSTASDNLQLTLAKIGDIFAPLAKGALDFATSLLQIVQNSLPLQAFLATIISLGIAIPGIVAAKAAWAGITGFLSVAIKGADGATKSWTRSIMANPILAAAAIIITGVIAISTAIKAFNKDLGASEKALNSKTQAEAKATTSMVRNRQEVESLIVLYKRYEGDAEKQAEVVKKLRGVHEHFSTALDKEKVGYEDLRTAADQYMQVANRDIKRAGMRAEVESYADSLKAAEDATISTMSTINTTMRGWGEEWTVNDIFEFDPETGKASLSKMGKLIAQNSDAYGRVFDMWSKELNTNLDDEVEAREKHNATVLKLNEEMFEENKANNAAANAEWIADRLRMEETAQEKEIRLTNEAFDARVEAAKEYGNDTAGLEAARQEMLDRIEEKYRKDRRKKRADALNNMKEFLEEESMKLKTENEQRIFDIEQRYDREIEKAKEAGLSTTKLEEAKTEAVERETQRQIQAKMKAEQDIWDIIDQNSRQFLSKQEQEVLAVEDKYNAMLDQAGLTAEQITEIENQRDAEQRRLAERHADDKLRLEQDLLEEIRLAKLGEVDQEAARMASEYAAIDEWLRTKLELYKDDADARVAIEEEAQRRKEAVMTDAQQRQLQMVQETNQAIEQALEASASALGEAIGDAMSGEDVDFGSTMLKLLGETLIQLGQIAIAYGITMDSIKKLIEDPLLAVVAGIAAVALGKVAVNKANNTMNGSAAGGANVSVPAFAEGGAVMGPTLSLIGENPTSRGEAVIPFEKMGQFADMMGINNSNGTNNVIVTGRLKGRDIQLSNNRGGKQRSRRH